MGYTANGEEPNIIYNCSLLEYCLLFVLNEAGVLCNYSVLVYSAKEG